MEKGYFAAAWGDVVKSPNWASLLIRLGLLCLIPVFGVAVMYGYLYSWARDISWNVHRPMPCKIFANEDGTLYKRGFFILVVVLVFSLVPSLLDSLISLFAGASFAGGSVYGSYAPVVFGLLLWLAGSAVSIGLAFLSVLFIWVGSMRVSLYATLSSGFQIQKIWAMMKHDFIGLLRILGMNIITGLVIVIGASILAMFLVVVCSGLIWLVSSSSSAAMFAAILLVVVGAAFVVSLLFASAFQSALTIRALGYWTRQFEVSQWSGQEDSMPFERNDAPSSSQGMYDSRGAVNCQCDSASYMGAPSVQPIPNASGQAPVRTAPFDPGENATTHASADSGSHFDSGNERFIPNDSTALAPAAVSKGDAVCEPAESINRDNLRNDGRVI